MKTKKLLFGLLMFATSAVFMVGCGERVSDPETFVYSVSISKNGVYSSGLIPGEPVFIDDIVKVCIDKEPEIEIGTINFYFDGDSIIVEEDFPYVYEKRMTTKGKHTITVEVKDMIISPGVITLTSKHESSFYVNKR